MNIKKSIQEDLTVIRAKLGDQDAFGALIERHHGRLLYYIRRMTGNREQADDVMQTVWLTAFKKIHTLRHAEAFSVWMYRIARSKCVNAIKDQSRFVPMDEQPIEHAAVEDHEPLFSIYGAKEIHSALESLAPVHREALTLRFMEDMDYEEMAEIFGVPVGTVRSRLHYAKLAMKDYLESQNKEENNHESRE